MTTLRRSLVAATALSGVAALLGLGWLSGLLPPFYAAEEPLLGRLLGSYAVAVVHTVAALVGVAVGILGFSGALDRRALGTVAVVELLVFGLALQSMATLSTVGYLLALAMPVVVVVLLVQVVRRYPVARWAVGLPGLAAIAVGVVVGRAPLAAEAGSLFPALARQSLVLAATLLVAALGAAWALVVVRNAQGTDAARRATGWVVRHRRVLTIVAATGPLPYALQRLTWLTPWPALVDDVDMSTRIWGLTLSSGAWLGAVLTLGLIRPWGETFPRWVPRWGGRPVPVYAAVVPGGLVAAVLTFSAVPVAVGMGEQGALWLSLVVFPCWYWGPALALAVWGYAAHRARVRMAV